MSLHPDIVYTVKGIFITWHLDMLENWEPCPKKLFSIALYSNSFPSPGYAPDPLSFIFPTPADATGTPGARQSSVNSRKATVVSRVVSLKGKISGCETKLGGKGTETFLCVSSGLLSLLPEA